MKSNRRFLGGWLLGFCAGSLLAYGSGFLYPYRIPLLVLFGLLAWGKPVGLALGALWALGFNTTWLMDSGQLFPTTSLQSVRVVQSVRSPHTAFLGEGRGEGCTQSIIQESRLLFQPNRSLLLCSTPEKSQDPLEGWYRAFYLGDLAAVSQETKASFAHLGLIHLLSVSGLHISFLAGILLFFLEGILHLFYGVRLLSPPVIYNLKIILKLTAAVLLLVYVVLIGGGHPGQRAWIMFILGLAVPYAFGGRLLFWDRVLLGLFLQSFFCPTGFLHPINALSWLSYLVVLKGMATPKDYLRASLTLTLLSFAFVGQFSFLSFVWNFLFTPMYYTVFLLTGFSYLLQLGRGLTLSALGLMERLLVFSDELLMENRYLFWDVKDSYHPLRILGLFGVMAYLFFSSKHKDSVTP
jgi:hypothetical protein